MAVTQADVNRLIALFRKDTDRKISQAKIEVRREFRDSQILFLSSEPFADEWERKMKKWEAELVRILRNRGLI
jgi:hypothetical protein